MDTQSKIDADQTAASPTSLRWNERATEVRARAGESNDLDVKAILEHIASLYDALAKRPH